MPSLNDEIYPGTCILLPKPSGDIRHLWIVLTEPEGDPPQVVIVNLTKQKNGADQTCVLQPGDHEFVKTETIVHYGDARLAPAEPLRTIAKMPGYDFHEDCSHQLLERVRKGLFDSPYTPKKIKTYCKDRFAPQAGAQAAIGPPKSN